jgi:hypothetical protein
VYATEETDINKLENEFLDKSTSWSDKCEVVRELEIVNSYVDRTDYVMALAELGVSEEYVNSVSVNESDYNPLPPEFKSSFSLRESPIHGLGVFLSAPADCGHIIGPARIGEKRTELGRYVNHSANPNCEYIIMGDDIYLKTVKDIKGCVSGDFGTELTIDYRKSASLKFEVLA